MSRKDDDEDYEIPEQLDWSNARRGAVVPAPPWKTRITIRIDTEILDWFRRQVNKAGGGNYQTLMNNALREHITRREGTLAELLRRVVREELARKKRQRPRRRK